MEKFGTDKIKDLALAIAQGVQFGIDELGDGFQFTDVFDALPLLGALGRVFKDTPELKAQLADLSTEELNELEAEIQNFSFSLEPVGDIVKEIIVWSLQTYKSVAKITKTVNKGNAA